jgi:uncharacterized protein
MLGSLARKLRIFGFDTAYFKEGDDSALVKLARRESRVILTSDKALFGGASRLGIPTLLVVGRSDGTRLAAVARAFRLDLKHRESRCAKCNGVLTKVGKQEAKDAAVPARVVARHRIFYRCTSCSSVYWRGGHWVRLRRLSSTIRRKDFT